MENSIDETIISLEKKYHQKLINNLRSRGWNLYFAGEAGISFTTERDIEECVSKGSEKEMLQEGFSYQVLPNIDEDSNWEKVKEAMNECIANIRYPFWADIVSGVEEDEDGNEKEYTKVIGVYLVDSIVYEKPNFELIVDYVLMSQLNILMESKGNIILHVEDVDKILKQLTLRIRKDSSDLISSQA